MKDYADYPSEEQQTLDSANEMREHEDDRENYEPQVDHGKIRRRDQWFRRAWDTAHMEREDEWIWSD